MPDTRLILHVKGTESQTKELPKQAVREALAKGELTESQLIWNPAESAWKPAREWPDLAAGERLILHVKGTESETKELPRKAIRQAISQGELTHSQLIWSPTENTWKQVRDLPELLPSQKLAPKPSPAARTAVIPMYKAAHGVATGTPVPRAAATPTPQVRAATPQVTAKIAVPEKPAAAHPTGNVATPSRRNLVVREESESSLVKRLCIGLGLFILLVLGTNYFLVDQPLTSELGQTPYSKVMVYAHLGAFVQPNVLVIHVPVSARLTPDDLTDFLVALARGTPHNPISGGLFGRVALTNKWTAQYSFSGYDWKQLGDMGKDDPAQRKEFLMDRMTDGSGRSLLGESTLNQQAQDQKREQVWRTFCDQLTGKP